MKNYQSKNGLVHRGGLGLQNAEELEGLIEGGWLTRVKTACEELLVIDEIVEGPVTCLLCMAAAPTD